LEGPTRVTPNEVAAGFAKLLGRPVRMEAVPRETWETLFRSQGMKNPLPRMQMLDGFNEGWIEFANRDGVLKGQVGIEAALKTLLERK
jgi:NAD(P)H dehydrogenase (quinone)